MKKVISIVLALMLTLSIGAINATAAENPIDTENPGLTAPPVFGDADGDGAVTMKDALAIQKYLVKLNTVLAVRSDVNEDGNVNMKDILTIQKHIAYLKTNTKCGQIMEDYLGTYENLSDEEVQKMADAYVSTLDDYDMETYGPASINYRTSLSDGSRLVSGTCEYLQYPSVMVYEPIGKYIYEYSEGYDFHIYKDDTYMSIKDAYENAVITDTMLNEIAVILFFKMR